MPKEFLQLVVSPATHVSSIRNSAQTCPEVYPVENLQLFAFTYLAGIPADRAKAIVKWAWSTQFPFLLTNTSAAPLRVFGYFS